VAGETEAGGGVGSPAARSGNAYGVSFGEPGIGVLRYGNVLAK